MGEGLGSIEIVIITALATLLGKDVFWNGVVALWNSITKTKRLTSQQFRKYLLDKVEEQSKVIISQTAIVAEQTLTIKAQTTEIAELKLLLKQVKVELDEVKVELDSIKDKNKGG